MKQPMNYSKGKSYQVRKTRAMAAGMKERTSIYKRMEKWEEVNPGKEGFTIKITLTPPWSFSETIYQPRCEFTSVSYAMLGIHRTWPATEEMIFMSKKSNEDRLIDLINVTNEMVKLRGKEADIIIMDDEVLP